MTTTSAFEFASDFLGLSLDTWIAIIAAAAAVLTLLFGEGLLLAIGNAFNSGYRWEAGPVRDPSTRVVETRVSQAYGDDRVLSMALVAVVPSLLLRILWLATHFHRVERFVTAARLLDQGTTMTLTSKAGKTLVTVLEQTVPVPTWKLWKRNRQHRDPATQRLVVILKFDRRRRLLSKTVREATGGLQPPSREAAEPAAHSAEAVEHATPPSSSARAPGS